MRQAVDRSSGTQAEALIELVGDIDQDGIEALAELLIAAAKRQLSDRDEEASDRQNDAPRK